MTEPQDPARRDALLDTLRQLPPADLRAAAAAVPPPLQRILLAIADHTARGDLDALLQNLQGDPAALQADLAQATASLGQQLAALSDAAALTGDASATAAVAAQGQLADLLRALLARSAPPDRLRRALTQALSAVEDDTVARSVRDVLREVDALSRDAQQALRDPTAPTPSLDARVAALEAQVAALETHSTAQRAALPGLLADVREVAQAQGSPAAAEVALVEAGLQATAAAWRQALQVARAVGHVRAAQVAGQRLQLDALQRGVPAEAAQFAAEVALVARDRADLRAEVIAHLEAATHLAAAEQATSATTLLRGVLQRAEGGPPALQAQTRLVAGQILLRAGQAAEARRAWRDLLRRADTPPELGARAALYLGRHLAETGSSPEALPLLEQARRVGLERREWPTYAPALVMLLRAAVEGNARPRVGELLREGRAAAGTFGGPDALTTLDRFQGWLASAWGAAAVDALLRGDA